MNKAELIDALTEKTGADRKTATDAVENIVDIIVRAVHRGESVTITGFGVFEQRRRAARVARNPRTGETVKVKPTSVPAFRPGAQFKQIIAGGLRIPASGPAVKRGSGATPTRRGAAAAAKKTAAKKTVAKKTAPAKTTRTTAAAKKTAPAKTTRATATKAATTTRATAAKKVPAKTTTAAKTTAAKKVPAKTTAVKATAAKTTAAKKTVAAKKAPAKKTTRAKR
ncbi:HU family DNA-binding protein [Millisia brevis]|uniref:HU family DNA-binding protein n=1 Tax=Millisia brevis TaxID=264148 RepID=UPI00082F63A2|nr:HU family DNA-binding protein [Millisia brevis]